MYKLFLLIFLVKFVTSIEIEQNCSSCSIGSINCCIIKITQNASDETFKFKFVKYSVRTFLLQNSNVPVWNTKVCPQFGNLLSTINLSNNGIVVVQKGSFNGCRTVSTLLLSHNSIEKLDIDVFDGLTNLQELSLEHNKLTSFDTKIIESLKSLESIILESNYLFDIDAKSIKQNLPNIQAIYIEDNNFLCCRLKEIKNELGPLYIETLTFYTRNYERQYVDGSYCLSVHQWMDQFYKGKIFVNTIFI